jgi:hypothetical protein
MSVPRRWVRIVRWAGAGLLLLAALAIAPPQARAGCTHPWVAALGDRSDRLADLELLRLGVDPDSARPLAPAPEDDDRSPCAGGRCVPAPDLPTGASVPTPPRRDTSVVLAFATKADEDRASPVVSAPVPLHPIHLSTRLDRPPRRLTPST